MKYLLLITFVLFGCDKPAIKSEITDNKEVIVDTLFTKEGCTIYRFLDSGRFHYYTRCGETITTHNCGKNCEYQENIK